MRRGIPIGQKLLIAAVCVIVLLTAVSCTDEDPLSYRSLPFSADIGGSIAVSSGRRIEFNAELVLYARTDTARGFLLTFRSPDALLGLSLERGEDGKLTLIRDGIRMPIDGSSLVGLTKIAEMLDPSDEIRRISSISGKDVGLGDIAYLTLVETATVRIYVHSESSRPVRAEFSDGQTEILLDSVNLRS